MRPMVRSAEVDAYLANVPEPQRTTLESLRKQIQAAAPEATEGIAYGMPAFGQDGRFLVSFAAYKRHCSLFPASEGVIAEHGDQLEGHLSGRGTIRFDPQDPLPAPLVTKIVKTRLSEIERKSPGGLGMPGPERQGLEPVLDPGPVAWVGEALRPWADGWPLKIGALVPSTYAAYGRLLHPAFDPEQGEVGWARVAEWSGRELKADSPFEDIATRQDGSRWPGSRPIDGQLERGVCARLARLFRPFTTTRSRRGTASGAAGEGSRARRSSSFRPSILGPIASSEVPWRRSPVWSSTSRIPRRSRY